MSRDPGCVQCGRCCEKWGWDQRGVPDDLLPWIRGGRSDILRHVRLTFADGRRASGEGIRQDDLGTVIRIDYWVDPGGRRLSSCPFLELRPGGPARCRIHTVKPAICTGFAPWDEGIRDYALDCPACRSSAP